MRLKLTTACILFCATAAAADPALLRLVPAEPQMVAGLDVERARLSPFGQRILAEMKDEDEQFRKLVESTGFDPRRDLREIVVASVKGASASEGVVLVRGAFDGARIGRFLEQEGGKKEVYRGVEIWQGKGKEQAAVFAFVNSALALFGNSGPVRAAIDRHQAGGADLAGALGARVQEWSRNDAWFVSGVPLSEMGRGPGGLVPGRLNVDSIREASAGVRFGSVVDLAGELNMRSAQDATALADLVRFIVSMVRANAAQPGVDELSKIVDSLQLATSGEMMKFSLSITEAQLEKLLDGGKRKARAVARR